MSEDKRPTSKLEKNPEQAEPSEPKTAHIEVSTERAETQIVGGSQHLFVCTIPLNEVSTTEAMGHLWDALYGLSRRMYAMADMKKKGKKEKPSLMDGVGDAWNTLKKGVGRA